MKLPVTTSQFSAVLINLCQLEKIIVNWLPQLQESSFLERHVRVLLKVRGETFTSSFCFSFWMIFPCITLSLTTNVVIEGCLLIQLAFVISLKFSIPFSSVVLWCPLFFAKHLTIPNIHNILPNYYVSNFLWEALRGDLFYDGIYKNAMKI